MYRVALTIVGLALAPFATGALAADPPAKTAAQLADAFGQREYVEQISLSPDGSKIAMLVAAQGRQAALLITDMFDKKRAG